MYSITNTSYRTTEDRRHRTHLTVRPPSAVYCRPEVGFPIRKSLDQSPFAAPQGLSQRTTSFIASQHQGIHQIPLRHLIASIINAHPKTRLREPLGRGLGRCPDDLLPSRHTRPSTDHTPGSTRTAADAAIPIKPVTPGCSARPLDQLASTLSSGTSHVFGPEGPTTSAVKHDIHPMRITQGTPNRRTMPRSMIRRTKRPRHPELANPGIRPATEVTKPNTPIRNRIESLFTMSKSQSMPFHRNRHQGHCRPQGANSAKLLSGPQPSRGRLTLCGTTLTTGGA